MCAGVGEPTDRRDNRRVDLRLSSRAARWAATCISKCGRGSCRMTHCNLYVLQCVGDMHATGRPNQGLCRCRLLANVSCKAVPACRRAQAACMLSLNFFSHTLNTILASTPMPRMHTPPMHMPLCTCPASSPCFVSHVLTSCRRGGVHLTFPAGNCIHLFCPHVFFMPFNFLQARWCGAQTFTSSTPVGR